MHCHKFFKHNKSHPPPSTLTCIIFNIFHANTLNFLNETIPIPIPHFFFSFGEKKLKKKKTPMTITCHKPHSWARDYWGSMKCGPHHGSCTLHIKSSVWMNSVGFCPRKHTWLCWYIPCWDCHHKLLVHCHTINSTKNNCIRSIQL